MQNRVNSNRTAWILGLLIIGFVCWLFWPSQKHQLASASRAKAVEVLPSPSNQKFAETARTVVAGNTKPEIKAPAAPEEALEDLPPAAAKRAFIGAMTKVYPRATKIGFRRLTETTDYIKNGKITNDYMQLEAEDGFILKRYAFKSLNYSNGREAESITLENRDGRWRVRGGVANLDAQPLGEAPVAYKVISEAVSSADDSGGGSQTYSAQKVRYAGRDAILAQETFPDSDVQKMAQSRADIFGAISTVINDPKAGSAPRAPNFLDSVVKRKEYIIDSKTGEVLLERRYSISNKLIAEAKIIILAEDPKLSESDFAIPTGAKVQLSSSGLK